MPFRFRKSFKIAPGFKINLSKSGLSTSIGKRGASLNIGKRGIRTTIGLPGTGLSYSTSTKAKAPSAYQGEGGDEGRSSSAGCLNGLLNLVFFPFRIFVDLLKSIINPQTRNSALILTGVLLGSCLAAFGVTSIMDGSSARATPAPTVDLVSVQTTALYIAWFPYTQTAAAIPTNTPLPSATLPPSSTATLIPTNTSAPTFTPIPTNTYVYIAPTQPPANSQCICSYDAYNCGDSLANVCFSVCISQGSGDIHRLDRDNDGYACEG